MLTLTTLFICAVAFGTLLNSVPSGASWRTGELAGVNNFRRIVGCTGLLISVLLMMIAICVV